MYYLLDSTTPEHELSKEEYFNTALYARVNSAFDNFTDILIEYKLINLFLKSFIMAYGGRIVASGKYYFSKWFNKFLKATFGKFLTLRFNVKYNTEKIQHLEPPYLIIGNHVGAWDPFLMSLGISEPVYFVISDAHFRHFWLKQVLKLVGGIPKSKHLADSGTIRAILSIKKNNGVIGLYPEGARNWDLKNVPVFYATAKLAKLLNIPVVNTLMEGAGLTRPRWARSSRTGIINMNYSILFKPGDIEKMSVDEIYQGIINGIHFNEYEWQDRNMIRFRGKNLAEFLDMFLVVCPRCKALCSMYSHKNTLTCVKCGYSVNYTEYGYLDGNDEPYFNNPQTWSDWQSSYLSSLFSQTEYTSGGKALFSDTDAMLFTGKRRSPLRQYKSRGKVELFHDRFVFTPKKGSIYTFPLHKLSGMNVQNNNKYEFYYEDILYRFRFTTQHKSIYKYELAVQIIKESYIAQ